jgi:hypothetical protein
MAAATPLQQADEVIIRYADTLSPADISFKLDGLLSPSQVRSRIVTLLETPDWLTAVQQDQLVTMKMRQLIVKLEEMTLTSRTAEILIRSLEALGNRLDRRYQATETDLHRLYAFQGVAFLDAVEAALDVMKHRLTTGEPITEADWDEALPPAITSAQLSLAAHEVSEEEQAPVITLAKPVSGNRKVAS